MRLAVNDQQGQPPLFIDVAPSAQAPKHAPSAPPKAGAIAVTGRLIYREWEADDGTRHSKHAVVGRVQIGGRPNGDQSAENDHTDDDKGSF